MEYFALSITLVSILCMGVAYMRLYTKQKRTQRALKITQSLKAKQKHEFDEWQQYKSYIRETLERKYNQVDEAYLALVERNKVLHDQLREAEANLKAKEFEITRLETITQNADEELANMIKDSHSAV